MNAMHRRYVNVKRRMLILKRIWKAFLRWGHHAVTLMFVPHSANKAVFTLHISNFMISFIVGVIAVLVVFAMHAYGDEEVSHPRIRELTQQVDDLDAEYETFREQSSRIMRNLDLFMQEFHNFKQTSLRYDGGAARRLFRMAMKERPAPDYLQAEFETAFTLPGEADGLLAAQRAVGHGSDYLARFGRLLDTIKPHVRLPFFSVYTRPVRSWQPGIWPVEAGRGTITSRFGDRYNPYTGSFFPHTGVDIAWNPGVFILATAPGEVVSAYYQGNYGLCVTIRHRDGYMTRYAHLETMEVFPGDLVYQGQYIGRMGSTGRSTGPHLHYEVIENRVHVDPEGFLPSRF